MEIVERILGKLVGYEMSNEELEMVSGGQTRCPIEQEQTWGSDNRNTCDTPQ